MSIFGYLVCFLLILPNAVILAVAPFDYGVKPRNVGVALVLIAWAAALLWMDSERQRMVRK